MEKNRAHDAAIPVSLKTSKFSEHPSLLIFSRASVRRVLRTPDS